VDELTVSVTRGRATSKEAASPVAGVLLAAGMSRRMGRNKLLLPWGGTTVLREVASTALSAGLDPLLVVLGHERRRVEAALAGLPHLSVGNPDYACGINTSLRAGFRAVPDRCGAAVVLLGDMPFVTASMVRELVRRFREEAAPLVLSTYGEVLAPPTLYGRGLFPELRALAGDGCGKQVMKRHRSRAVEVAWPAASLSDLDEPSDLSRARARMERS